MAPYWNQLKVAAERLVDRERRAVSIRGRPPAVAGVEAACATVVVDGYRDQQHPKGSSARP
jgi:hypothetical protein